MKELFSLLIRITVFSITWQICLEKDFNFVIDFYYPLLFAPRPSILYPLLPSLSLSYVTSVRLDLLSPSFRISFFSCFAQSSFIDALICSLSMSEMKKGHKEWNEKDYEGIIWFQSSCTRPTISSVRICNLVRSYQNKGHYGLI